MFLKYISQVGNACPGVQKVVDALDSIKHKVRLPAPYQLRNIVLWICVLVLQVKSLEGFIRELLLASHSMCSGREMIIESSSVGKKAVF